MGAVQPPPEVFDLFAVPGHAIALQGGRGTSVLAGDLVLSPGRDADTASWLSPVLARLAAQLDHEQTRSLRLAMPIPTRDLRWVVDGWGATRFEPGTRACQDLDVLVATGRLLHAHLKAALIVPPSGLRTRHDRWSRAERVAFGADPVSEAPGVSATSSRRNAAEVQELVSDLCAERDAAGSGPSDLGPDQLVHRDLAGNVLLDSSGLPLVIDLAPSWRPALWAEAVCVLDAVLWLQADPQVMHEWAEGPRRQAMLRAGIFRVLSDRPCDVAAYRRVLAPA